MLRNFAQKLPNRTGAARGFYIRSLAPKTQGDVRASGGKMGQPAARTGGSSAAVRKKLDSPPVASRSLDCAIDGLRAVKAALGNGLAAGFEEAVSLMRGCEGRVIVSGMGKSGHVGQKIAATLASTGTPAQFVHPAEQGFCRRR